jgi:AcrR family transcriptional regulator
MKKVDPLTDLLWNGVAQPKRGPRPTLSLPMIAGAGIELADAGGLESVTMEAVAQRLGLTKMALYRYVPGKAELVALMVEVGLGEPPAPNAAARAKGWRKQLRVWARALFEKFSQHPWALEATLGARAVGPNEVAWLDRALAAQVDTGLDGADKLDVVVTLIGHVRHLVQQAGPSDSERAFLDAMRALTEGRAERYPALTAVLAEPATQQGLGAALDFGLDRILDGVETLVARANERSKARKKPRRTRS